MRHALTLLPTVLALALVAVLPLHGAPRPSATLNVAPDGSDAADGSSARPFATPARARDAVRRLRRDRPEVGDVTVRLRGGTYRLAETLVFGLSDSAPDGHTTTFAAAAGERAILSAGVPITDWRPAEDLPACVPPKAARHIRVATLPPDLPPFHTLYDAAGRLPRAVAKGFTPRAKDKQGRPGDRSRMPAGPDVLRLLQTGGDAAVTIAPQNPWVRNVLPVDRVDSGAGAVHTAVPGTYPLRPLRWGASHFTEGTLWVENVLGALDAPGEWVLDHEARRLYLWPRDGQPKGVEAPALTEMIRIEGDIDYEGPRDEPVRGLVLCGLTVTHTDRRPMPADHRGRGIQHDWELFDAPTAAVRLRGAERCVLEHCRLAHVGGTAVRLDLHARRNRISHCLVEHTGQVGILLAGYGPGTKDVNRENVVHNNHIHDVGEIVAHCPALFLWQSGHNAVTHNRIHRTPYSAVVLSGRIALDRRGRGECSKTVRWHELPDGIRMRETYDSWKEREPFLHGRGNRLVRNDLSDVMRQLGDGNCIYVSGAGGGNVLRENYCHDVLDTTRLIAAIRCDDDQHETLIQRNVIHRCVGDGLVSKGRNTIRNNLFADLRVETPDGRAALHQRGHVVLVWGEVAESRIERNVVLALDPRLKVNTDGYFPRRGLALLKDCRVDHNVYFCPKDAGWADAYLAKQRAEANEQHSIQADPRFRDPAAGDFRFRDGSPAAAMGIEGVHIAEVAGPKEPIFAPEAASAR